MNCWLAQFSDASCDGRMDRAHLISQQLMKRELRTSPRIVELAAILGDPRGWVPACRKHHGAFDVARTIRVPRSSLPVGVEDLALELGLEWWLEREYGPLIEDAA